MSNTPGINTISTSSDIVKANFDIQEAAGWLGHQIKAGFDFLVDTVKWIWDTVSSFITETAFPFVKDGTLKAYDFLRTSAGLTSVGVATGAGLWIASTKVDEKDAIAKAALQVGSVAAFCLASIAGYIGLQNGWNAQIV